ncbi:MAG TPA: hypothetical protein PLS49_09725, partial [Candidatus Woesebacteria bacterium]|nr:hypothetical protein [Candidatus Woesebacteria bacterium]
MRNKFEGLEVRVSNFDEDGIWDGPDGDEMIRVELIEEPSVINNIIYNELDCFIKAKIQQYALVKSENSNASNYEKTLQLTLEVYERIKMSYRNIDISEELGISDQSVRHYRKEIIKSIKYMALHNPFVGNKIQVKKSISQDTWDAKLKENKKE